MSNCIGDGLRTGSEEFPIGSNPREPLIYIYYLYNFKLASMPTFIYSQIEYHLKMRRGKTERSLINWYLYSTFKININLNFIKKYESAYHF